MSRPNLLRRAIWLSVLSIVISGIVGTVAVFTAASSGSLSLLGFGFDAAIDAAASVTLVWRFAIEARQPHRGERVERIAEAAIGAVLVVLATYLVQHARGIDRRRRGRHRGHGADVPQGDLKAAEPVRGEHLRRRPPRAKSVLADSAQRAPSRTSFRTR